MAGKGKVAVSITADNSSLKKGIRYAEGDLGRLQRVGVSSTWIVKDGVTPAVSPTPMKKRRTAKTSHAPLGTTPIKPELTAQMKVPMIIVLLRPQASDSPPKTSAPRIAPTPPL